MTRLVIHFALGEDEEEGSFEPGPDVSEADQYVAPLALRRAPFLKTLRVFQFGPDAKDDYHANWLVDTPIDPYDNPFPAQGEYVLDIIRELPRLEEWRLLANLYDMGDLYALPTFQHLRILQVYHALDHRLAELAANSSLGRLTHLLLHPHAPQNDNYSHLPLGDVRALVDSPHLTSLTHLQLRLSNMGDAGVKEIIRSGILRRLEVLDLRHGCVTDAGARALAQSLNIKHLQSLDLQRNRLTPAGIAALESLGLPELRVENQQVPGPHGEYNDD